MRHKIVAVGFLGDFTCYLDVDREIALERWKEPFLKEGSESPDDPCIIEFEFDDEFLAYEVSKRW